jgi:chaperone BCS1
LHISYLSLAGGELDDDSLNTLLNSTEVNSIILLEDIDALFQGREAVNKKDNNGRHRRRSGPSFSGLLNALDGVRSQEGRILIMTTKHKEKLDAALLRPGRADRLFELGNAKPCQLIGLFKRMFPESTQE